MSKFINREEELEREVELLRGQRDDARRKLCDSLSAISWISGKGDRVSKETIAIEAGWIYLYEEAISD